MKLTSVSFSIAASLSLSGCYSLPVYHEAPVPQANVGGVRDDAGWRPYAAPVPEPRPEGEWTPRNRDWGAEPPRRAETAVRREELPAVDAMPSVEDEDRPVTSEVVPREEPTFTRALPKDPPTDPMRRRTYSSRPDRNAELNKDASAFGRGAGASTATPDRAHRGIRSEWADKVVRGDNRPAFDRMVSESSRLGKGSFEDEAGRIYYGERRGNEGGCDVVEVTVTTNGGLPVVSRGLAYDCR
jgi:hypothetical protein|nr:hypothetical protein [Neorhizobium tomejilense]